LDKPIDTIDTAALYDALARFTYGEETQYFAHGEDWGALIATELGQLYPNRVKGLHLTLAASPDSIDLFAALYSIVVPFFPNYFYTLEEISIGLPSRYTLASRANGILKDLGYMHLQATWPDSIGHGLTDSPVGLLAYILEKYSSWSFDFDTEIRGKTDGGLKNFNKDELLTITTLYWMTNSITSSMRYYKNSFGVFSKDAPWPKSHMLKSIVPNSVAVAYQYFQNDIFFFPKCVLEFRYPNLKSYHLVKGGGHFTAFQNPKLSADDLIQFISS
jgi:microsomal epoxide hydrolase